MKRLHLSNQFVIYEIQVKYAMGEDLDLATHVDASDITLNVCLGRTFTGMYHTIILFQPAIHARASVCSLRYQSINRCIIIFSSSERRSWCRRR
jgi:hypothetical protein